MQELLTQLDGKVKRWELKEVAESTVQNVEQLKSFGSIFCHSSAFLSKKGTLLRVIVNARLCQNDMGEEYFYTTITLDPKERNAMLETLRANEEIKQINAVYRLTAEYMGQRIGQ